MEPALPIEAHVRWDRRRARPAAVRWPGHCLSVLEVTAQRDELAAYPAERGPRVTYLLETDGGRAALVFDGGRRRWYLQALDAAA